MDSQKVDLFLITNGKFFPPAQLPFIREQLLELDETKWVYLQAASFSDPTMLLIVSIFLGSWGIDRFILGNVGMGVGKLLTLGGCGIWTIIDWFMIMDATREKNINTLQQIILI